MKYVLKQIPEDFIVKEKINLKFINSGKYSYYKLTKKTYSTEKAIEIISKKLKIKRKYINYSGNKDKQALTEQYISISKGPKRNLNLKDIKLEFLGKGKERINLGTHYANEFEITIRNLPKNTKISLLPQYPNYFDEQRFGINKNNHKIGKLLIEKKFKEACSLLSENTQISEHLKLYPNDFIGALNKIPKRTLWLFCHAYQSYLWNLKVHDYLKNFKHKHIKILKKLAVPLEKIKNKKIPLPKFGKIKQLPNLELKPKKRDLFMNLSDFRLYKLEPDELNKNKMKFKISFTLGKGSYATVLIKCLFNLY